MAILETLNTGTFEEFHLKPTGSQLCFPNLFSFLMFDTLLNFADSHAVVLYYYNPTNISSVPYILITFVFFHYKKLTYLLLSHES